MTNPVEGILISTVGGTGEIMDMYDNHSSLENTFNKGSQTNLALSQKPIGEEYMLPLHMNVDLGLYSGSNNHVAGIPPFDLISGSEPQQGIATDERIDHFQLLSMGNETPLDLHEIMPSHQANGKIDHKELAALRNISREPSLHTELPIMSKSNSGSSQGPQAAVVVMVPSLEITQQAESAPVESGKVMGVHGGESHYQVKGQPSERPGEFDSLAEFTPMDMQRPVSASNKDMKQPIIRDKNRILSDAKTRRPRSADVAPKVDSRWKLPPGTTRGRDALTTIPEQFPKSSVSNRSRSIQGDNDLRLKAKEGKNAWKLHMNPRWKPISTSTACNEIVEYRVAESKFEDGLMIDRNRMEHVSDFSVAQNGFDNTIPDVDYESTAIKPAAEPKGLAYVSDRHLNDRMVNGTHNRIFGVAKENEHANMALNAQNHMVSNTEDRLFGPPVISTSSASMLKSRSYVNKMQPGITVPERSRTSYQSKREVDQNQPVQSNLDFAPRRRKLHLDDFSQDRIFGNDEVSSNACRQRTQGRDAPLTSLNGHESNTGVRRFSRDSIARNPITGSNQYLAQKVVSQRSDLTSGRGRLSVTDPRLVNPITGEGMPYLPVPKPSYPRRFFEVRRNPITGEGCQFMPMQRELEILVQTNTRKVR